MVGFLALTAMPVPVAAQDTTLGIKPWLPSGGPPEPVDLDRQRTDVYRDRLEAETRRFELHGERSDPRAADRDRSFRQELGRLQRVGPPGVGRRSGPGAPLGSPR